AAALAALQGQLRAVDGARALGGRRARRGAVGRRPDRGRRRRLLAADRPAAGPAGNPHAQPARRNPVPAGGLSMGKLKGLLKSGWFITLVGLLLLAAIIWFFGPYLGIAGRQPLVGPVARLALILSIVLAWAIWTQVQHLRHRSRAQKLGSELAAQSSPDDDRQGVAATERAQLQQRFRDAVKMLRKTRGRGSLYSLPWYMVIGPPGSGKSTLVRNSGLQFPLAGQFGKESLRGVGGTRNCDWWFTDEAVFLDTAGRYTTQVTDQLADAGAWTGFLCMLRRFRRNRPIN